MKFSLILATYGRKEEVRSFIESLNNQSYKNYELIIVDQNPDNYIYKLYIKNKENMEIKYIHTDQKGLSKARNLGLKSAEGDIIAFPDDDCEYPPEILENVYKFFRDNDSYDILTCKSKDKDSGLDSNGKWLQEDQDISYANSLKVAISYTVFIKIRKHGDIVFDEKLGVGAIYGSGEETDMLLNLLHQGYKGRYESSLYVYHPAKPLNVNRVYNYALGMGAVINKEIKLRKNSAFVSKLLIMVMAKPAAGIVLSVLTLNRNGVKIFFNQLRGRITGYLKYPDQL